MVALLATLVHLETSIPQKCFSFSLFSFPFSVYRGWIAGCSCYSRDGEILSSVTRRKIYVYLCAILFKRVPCNASFARLLFLSTCTRGLRPCDRTREQSFTERKRAVTKTETKQEEKRGKKGGKKGKRKVSRDRDESWQTDGRREK